MAKAIAKVTKAHARKVLREVVKIINDKGLNAQAFQDVITALQGPDEPHRYVDGGAYATY